MKLIRRTRLWFQEGNSDKVYEVDLCRTITGRYRVNFRYGRRGTLLREGTKTVTPVDVDSAEKIFNSVVVAKKNKGYQDEQQRQTLTPDSDAKQSDLPDRAGSEKERVKAGALERFRDAAKIHNLQQLRRAVWRVGELEIRSAAKDLTALIPAKDDLLNYCVAWALGRCGDAIALPSLERLHRAHQAGHVRRICVEAILAVADNEKRKVLVDQFTVGQSADDPEVGYLIAAVDPVRHKKVLTCLETLPFAPGTFRAIRHIFKAAEFRRDDAVFGLLARRFEMEKAYFSQPGYGNTVYTRSFGYLNVKKEITKRDSRLAYSNYTRDYFRRRVWRTLKRMGNDQHPDYPRMAASVLLQFTDDDAKKPKVSEIRSYQQREDGRWGSVLVARNSYGPFAGYVAFNHILYTNSLRFQPGRRGLAWVSLKTERADDPEREEAFPHLWDRQPERLLNLLEKSRCAPVHRFAAHALSENTAYCDTLSINHLRMLMVSGYAPTMVLGLKLICKRYDPTAPDTDLIEAVLMAPDEKIRGVAQKWVEAQPGLLGQAQRLVQSILISPYRDIRAWGAAMLLTANLSEEQIRMLMVRLTAHIMGLDRETEERNALIQDLGRLFTEQWSEYWRQVNLKVILDLLGHPLTPVRILAATLLIDHKTPPDQLPPDLIRTLIDSDSPELKGLGVTLFSRLPDEILLGQLDLVYPFCVDAEHKVRQAVQPLVKRLAGHENFGDDLLLRLLPHFFRKESATGLHADLLALTAEGLATAAARLDQQMVWRLLKARSRGAQALGAQLLPRLSMEKLSLRQWALLGNHALLAVRQNTFRIYEANVSKIRSQLTDGLRLLNSDWEESRAFAMTFFRTHVTADDWTPALLVGICDSVRDDVQAFGRELLMTFFKEEDGVEYLIKLSQHPSRNVQLFASNFLEDFAAGHLQRIEQLSPYFITVLSQVNRGRVAKNRVVDFLHTEACASPEAALIIAPIFGRISATIALGDKGDSIRILRDIKRRYPQIPSPLTVLPVPRHISKGF